MLGVDRCFPDCGGLVQAAHVDPLRPVCRAGQPRRGGLRSAAGPTRTWSSAPPPASSRPTSRSARPIIASPTPRRSPASASDRIGHTALRSTEYQHRTTANHKTITRPNGISAVVEPQGVREHAHGGGADAQASSIGHTVLRREEVLAIASVAERHFGDAGTEPGNHGSSSRGQ